MACILLWSSAVRVHDSQAYRKMDLTGECISCILELREILPSFQTEKNQKAKTHLARPNEMSMMTTMSIASDWVLLIPGFRLLSKMVLRCILNVIFDVLVLKLEPCPTHETVLVLNLAFFWDFKSDRETSAWSKVYGMQVRGRYPLWEDTVKI